MHYRLQWLRRLGILLILISTFGLGSCSSMSINSVTTTNPSLQLEDYFKGKTQAHGVLLDRSGAATRYFNVDIIGTWVAETQTLTLDERFVFNDGEKSQRIWTITKQAPDRYSGRAADVVGTAQGTVKGNVLNWQYVLQVPYKGSTINVNFDDWMYLMNDKVLLNKAIMSKWGFKVGEVVITFEKL
ncbi:MAG: DUF3833 domain-containing protein [Thiofilum sp.]|uniref:DUF3833 domain-containing protein n=3 Tax=Thiofilum sp. TaxID=2212733 RepID=UPI003BAE9407